MDQFIMHMDETNPHECNHKKYMDTYLKLYTDCLKVKQSNPNINTSNYGCNYYLLKFLTYHKYDNKNK